MMLRAFFLFMITFLAACASAPDVTHPELEIDIPAQWTARETSPGEIDEQWWTAFNDPELNRIVHLVLDNNYELRSAAARVDQAAAQAKIVGADQWPSVGAGFGATRRRQNFIGFPVGGGGEDVISTTSTNYGVSLDTTWEVDLWGRIRSQAAASLADYEAARADLHGAYLSLAGQAVKAWLALAEATQQKALAERTVESFTKSANLVRSRYQRGLRPSLDVRLAESNLADAEALLALRDQQLDATLRQLEVLMGRYPGRTVTPPDAYPESYPEIPAGLPAELVSRRPDLAAAERRLAASGLRMESSKAALYPRISLTASGGTASEAIGDLLDGDFRVWSLIGNLTQPIFEGGRLLADVDRTEAARQEALFTYAGSVLTAFAEVESVLAAEEYLTDQVAALTVAAEQAEAASRLAEDRYRAGLDEYIPVLESQRRALTNQGTLLETRRIRLENRVDLYLSLGGGFSEASFHEATREDQTASLETESSP
jgi:NodT family efflux transporter outer membrane factor (OMF) lipoprotein